MMESSDPPPPEAPSVAPASPFIVLYQTHVDEVYRYVHRRCRDHGLAEDITQETFMAAMRSTKDPDTLSIGWLLTVARNRLIDVLRRQASYEGKLRLVGVGEEEGHAAMLAEKLRVESALDDLRPDYRLVLTLHYIDGLTVPELAKELGRSVKSVEGIVTRARRELRRRLDNEDVDTGGGKKREGNHG